MYILVKTIVACEHHTLLHIVIYRPKGCRDQPIDRNGGWGHSGLPSRRNRGQSGVLEKYVSPQPPGSFLPPTRAATHGKQVGGHKFYPRPTKGKKSICRGNVKMRTWWHFPSQDRPRGGSLPPTPSDY